MSKNIDSVLASEAEKFISKNALAKPGDIVITTWATWKKPRRVRIKSVGAHLVCRYDDELKDWVAGFAMNYSAERLNKNGESVERNGCAICLSNFNTDDGKSWDVGGRWREEFGFNHAGLSWGERRKEIRALRAAQKGQQ